MSTFQNRKKDFNRQLIIMGALAAANFLYAVFVFSFVDSNDTSSASMFQTVMVVLVSGLSFVVLYRINRNKIEFSKALEDLEANDKLTGLTNRAVFQQRLHDAVHCDNIGPFALMLIDIDRFKELNTRLGYAGADQLLKEFSSRLLDFSSKKDYCARISGNQFAVIVPYNGTGPDLEAQMEGLFTALYRPYEIDGKQIDFTISAGITLYPDDGQDHSELNQFAELALLRAKEQGHNRVFCYEESIDNQTQDFQVLSQDMDRALRNREFKLYFQPQFCFSTGRQVGFEALIRWEHPQRGMISPSVFIPIAEMNGLILPMSEFALMEACKIAASWKNPLRVAVNLSPIQMQQVDVAELTERALLTTGLDPNRLELEVTESLFIDANAQTADMLSRIRSLGVTVALDDFGTGYSSLNYLANFPFDKLKIDRSFVKDITHDANAMAIISAVIGMAKSLEMNITAEGIENEESHEILRIAGCNEAQGFLLGKPRDIIANPGAEMLSTLSSPDLSDSGTKNPQSSQIDTDSGPVALSA